MMSSRKPSAITPIPEVIFEESSESRSESSSDTNGSASVCLPGGSESQADPHLAALREVSWFWEDIGREEVNELMKDSADGTFLVRLSVTTPGDYTLTLRKDGANKLIKIYQKSDRYGFSLPPASGEPLPFDSVIRLIDYYSKNSLKDYNQNLDIPLLFPLCRPTIDEESSGLSTKELTERLSDAHREYLAQSRRYDLCYDQLVKDTRLVQSKRHALVAFRETVRVLGEHLQLSQKLTKDVRSHEIGKMQRNSKTIEEKKSEVERLKDALEAEIASMTEANKAAERELNILKPELIRLYRKREFLQRHLVLKGVSQPQVQQVLREAEGSLRVGSGDEYLVISEGSEATGPPASYIDFQPSTIRLFSDEDEFRSSWYLPTASRDEAERRLNGRKDGTFLIRNSAATPYALSLSCGGKIFHCQIVEEKSTKRVGFKDTQMNFPSLTHFVRHYATNSLKDHNKELNTTLLYPVNGDL